MSRVLHDGVLKKRSVAIGLERYQERYVTLCYNEIQQKKSLLYYTKKGDKQFKGALRAAGRTAATAAACRRRRRYRRRLLQAAGGDCRARAAPPASRRRRRGCALTLRARRCVILDVHCVGVIPLSKAIVKPQGKQAFASGVLRRSAYDSPAAGGGGGGAPMQQQFHFVFTLSTDSVLYTFAADNESEYLKWIQVRHKSLWLVVDDASVCVCVCARTHVHSAQCRPRFPPAADACSLRGAAMRRVCLDLCGACVMPRCVDVE